MDQRGLLAREPGDNVERVLNIDARELEDLDEFMEGLSNGSSDLPTPKFSVTMPSSEDYAASGIETPTGNPKYPSARWWMGTSYYGILPSMNEDDALVEQYFTQLLGQLGARALIGQIEKCPETGRLHAQYAARFHSTIRMSALKKKRKGDHFEMIRRRDSAIAYCSKEQTRYSHTFVKIGDFPVPNGEVKGSLKLDWDEILYCAKRGLHSKIPARIRLQYHSSISKLHQECQERVQVTDCVKGIWLYGKPGLGKTRFVFSQYDDPRSIDGIEASTLYLKSLDRWWDGFKNNLHQTVFMDEVSPENKSQLAASLKQWADAMSFQGEVKGCKMVPKFDKFIVASNYTIKEFSAGDVGLEKALLRRYMVIEWPDSGPMLIKMPFPLFFKGDLIDRLDVHGAMTMAREFYSNYMAYAKKSISLGFNRPLALYYVSAPGTLDETHFIVSHSGRYAVIDLSLVSSEAAILEQQNLLNN